MILRKNLADNCLLISMEKRARCAGCGNWLEQGTWAWSYLPRGIMSNAARVVMGCRLI